jgi:hypothetical protein
MAVVLGWRGSEVLSGPGNTDDQSCAMQFVLTINALTS